MDRGTPTFTAHKPDEVPDIAAATAVRIEDLFVLSDGVDVEKGMVEHHGFPTSNVPPLGDDIVRTFFAMAPAVLDVLALFATDGDDRVAGMESTL
jgi:hypothetical protein